MMPWVCFMESQCNKLICRTKMKWESNFQNTYKPLFLYNYMYMPDNNYVLTKQLVGQGYRLEKLKIYIQSFMVDTIIYYSITILPIRSFCVTY